MRGKKLLPSSAVNESLHSLLRNNSHSCLFSLRIPSYNSFSACNQTMRLFLACGTTGSNAIEACMGKILSSVFFTDNQSCRVSTIHIPTFRQQSNFPFDYCFRTSSFPFVLFHVEGLLQLEQVVPLHKDSNDKNNHCSKHFVAVSTEPISLEVINSFSGAPVV